MEGNILQYTFRHIFLMCICTAIVALIAGCGGTVITYEQQLLGEADSLFRAGNYEYAKVKYDKIRTLKPNSPAARTSQYYLGYINVYYENPFASWEAALREFKLFVSLYPDDSRVDEVNSWIKLLVVMQSFKKDYIGTNEEIEVLKQQKNKLQKTPQKPTVNVEALNESLRHCYHVSDSLNKRSKDLENFILDLEKKCQQAGK
jgi:outer membrane protein assembly factor BamD (BamD/ComL family)